MHNTAPLFYRFLGYRVNTEKVPMIPAPPRPPTPLALSAASRQDLPLSEYRPHPMGQVVDKRVKPLRKRERGWVGGWGGVKGVQLALLDATFPVPSVKRWYHPAAIDPIPTPRSLIGSASRAASGA